MKLDIVRT